jgi:hypothetical protein
MLPRSACPPRQPDTAAQPAEVQRSYTTSWGTIDTTASARLTSRLTWQRRRVERGKTTTIPRKIYLSISRAWVVSI